MRKVSSGHLLSIETFYSINDSVVDSEGPDQTADAQTDLGRCCPHMFEDTVSNGAAHFFSPVTASEL